MNNLSSSANSPLEDVLLEENEAKNKIDENVFLCPLVPLLPCFGIWSNLILCAMGGNPLVWKLFLSFEFVGILIYVFYGQYHSKLSTKIEKHKAKERNKGSPIALDEAATSVIN